MRAAKIPTHDEVEMIQRQLVQRIPFDVSDLRVERPMAKALLLDGEFLFQGEMYVPSAKNLGLGVYSVRMKKKEYTSAVKNS